jgi:hypothetical protein
MQNNQPSEVTEVLSTSPVVLEAPKAYRYDTSSSDGNKASGFTSDMPTPYNLNGNEKKRKFSGKPNPHRKYSKSWWGHAYDAAVEVGKWPRVTYVLFGCILIGAWVAVM